MSFKVTLKNNALRNSVRNVFFCHLSFCSVYFCPDSEDHKKSRYTTRSRVDKRLLRKLDKLVASLCIRRNGRKVVAVTAPAEERFRMASFSR